MHLSTVIRIKYNSAMHYKPKVTYYHNVWIFVNYFIFICMIWKILFDEIVGFLGIMPLIDLFKSGAITA